MSEFDGELVKRAFHEEVQKDRIDSIVGQDLTIEQRTVIRAMAQLKSVPLPDYGYNYNGSKYNSRVKAAGNVYFNGCQKNIITDSCDHCAVFLVALCEINNGIIDINE